MNPKPSSQSAANAAVETARLLQLEPRSQAERDAAFGDINQMVALASCYFLAEAENGYDAARSCCDAFRAMHAAVTIAARTGERCKSSLTAADLSEPADFSGQGKGIHSDLIRRAILATGFGLTNLSGDLEPMIGRDWSALLADLECLINEYDNLAEQQGSKLGIFPKRQIGTHARYSTPGRQNGLPI